MIQRKRISYTELKKYSSERISEDGMLCSGDGSGCGIRWVKEEKRIELNLLFRKTEKRNCRDCKILG